jgi:threonine/homoserine/homoserine lactone efflux protein
MSAIAEFPLFVTAALLLIITPGPDTAYIVGRSVAQGRMAGAVSVLGIQLGMCVHIAFTVFGLTALVASSSTAFAAVKFSGALYLAWIGARMVFGKPADATGTQARENSPDAEGLDQRPAPLLLRQAFVSNVLNPKVMVFFLSFFPQFVITSHPQRHLAFLLLGATMLVLNASVQLPMVWLAARVTRGLRASHVWRRRLECCAGIAFVAIGFKLAFTERP